MYQNYDIGRNTLYVNDMLVRIFKIVLVAIAIAVFLKAAGIIALPWLHLAATAGAGAVACLLPIACRSFRMDGNMLKHVNVYCTAALCVFGYIYLNMDLIMLLVVPIGFACLYFDLKLVGYTAALSSLGLVLGEVLNIRANWSLATMDAGSYISIAASVLQLAIAAILSAAVVKNALKMFSNAQSFYKNINDIFSNMKASSQSLAAAEGKILQGAGSLNGNEEKKEEALPAAEEDLSSYNAAVRTIISNINKSVDNAREIMKYNQAIFTAKGKDQKIGDELTRLEEYKKSSAELVSKLSRYTDKIKEDLSLISVMIDESKQLSKNAAEEAENASSGGKGSAIIAMKVEKLADESAESASHIQELLNGVVNDAENTVKTVAETYEEVLKSLELINRSVETLIKWLMYKNM